MFTKSLAGAAVIVPGALLLLGTASACTPSTAVLPCRAVAVTPAPLQNGVESIKVTTAPASQVRTEAFFDSGIVVRSTSSDTAGRASVAYPVGSATAGYPVKVLVTVTKASQKGACQTSFTPTAVPTIPTGDPVVQTCADEILPVNQYYAAQQTDTPPTQSRNITMTSASAGTPSCGAASQLAALPSKTDANGNPIFSQAGWTCTSAPSAVSLGAGATHYSCASSSATITFDYLPLPITSCGNVDVYISNVRQANTDCATSTTVASYPANQWRTQGGPAAYQTLGYTCIQQRFTDFQCYTADGLHSIFWTPTRPAV